MDKALEGAVIVGYCKPFITPPMKASGSPPEGVEIDAQETIQILIISKGKIL